MTKYFTFLVAFWSLNAQGQITLTMDWLDLIPVAERATTISVASELNHEQIFEQSLVGGMRHDLDGKLIEIPGFVIPLDASQEITKEFLLVPFLGACIHVPPPPPNQIVYVEYEEGAPLYDLWDMVTVTGRLSVKPFNVGGITTGYSLDGITVEPYEDVVE